MSNLLKVARAIPAAGAIALVSLTACTSGRPTETPSAHQSEVSAQILFDKYSQIMRQHLTGLATDCAPGSEASAECRKTVAAAAVTLHDIRTDAQASPAKYKDVLDVLAKLDTDVQKFQQACASGQDASACGEAEFAIQAAANTAFALLSQIKTAGQP